MNRLARRSLSLSMAVFICSYSVCALAVGPINQLANGGFESPVLPTDSYITLNPSSGSFGWQVTTGDIDVIRLPLTNPQIDFAAFEGSQVLDLNGSQQGAISQDFATVPGQIYLLAFTYADNPRAAGFSTASVLVSDVTTSAPLMSDLVAHATSTISIADYDQLGRTFVAVGSATRLAFVSTSGGDPSGGVFLDAVSVTAIPEPASLILCASVLGFLVLCSRQGRGLDYCLRAIGV